MFQRTHVNVNNNRHCSRGTSAALAGPAPTASEHRSALSSEQSAPSAGQRQQSTVAAVSRPPPARRPPPALTLALKSLRPTQICHSN
ncbi:unnamed protein product, partial [Brenthis ino]